MADITTAKEAATTYSIRVSREVVRPKTAQKKSPIGGNRNRLKKKSVKIEYSLIIQGFERNVNMFLKLNEQQAEIIITALLKEIEDLKAEMFLLKKSDADREGKKSDE